MNPFEYRKPNTEQVEMIERVRKACFELNELINEIPVGYDNMSYLDNAKEKLQEVSMWTNKAIVFHEGGDLRANSEVSSVSSEACYRMCTCGEFDCCSNCSCNNVAGVDESFSMPSVEGFIVVESEEDSGG